MPTPTQNFVPIKEIRDGIVIMKDGSIFSVVMTTSINLALKSEEEHNAIIGQFQNLLNSLDFSLQFVVQSRELNIRPYIQGLEKRLETQEEDLLRVQIEEYINFINWFTQTTNIMTKSFYIVVPYGGVILNTKSSGGFIKSVFSSKDKNSGGGLSEQFEEKRTQLEQRIAVVQQGMNSIGLRNAVLDTQQLIELFYGVFNPEEPKKTINLDGRASSSKDSDPSNHNKL
jgi:type IV secretory pathway VirB4 component